MLFELKQIYATGNGSSTICYIVQNPRKEFGLNIAEIVGENAGFSETTGEIMYKVCQPKKIIIGGNFTMVEYTKELITEQSRRK